MVRTVSHTLELLFGMVGRAEPWWSALFPRRWWSLWAPWVSVTLPTPRRCIKAASSDREDRSTVCVGSGRPCPALPRGSGHALLSGPAQASPASVMLWVSPWCCRNTKSTKYWGVGRAWKQDPLPTWSSRAASTGPGLPGAPTAAASSSSCGRSTQAWGGAELQPHPKHDLPGLQFGHHLSCPGTLDASQPLPTR